ncbi:hypothetical protein WN944_015604 [Citrus x changshan-huyou]|uniref:Uncharacterized protein n=1 Tax=Citrus x changshan-huyou TaxID=2935761 RepID=A0AAP0QR87_9ROSI
MSLIVCCFEIPFSKLSFVAFFLGVKLFYGCYYEIFSQDYTTDHLKEII